MAEDILMLSRRPPSIRLTLSLNASAMKFFKKCFSESRVGVQPKSTNLLLGLFAPVSVFCFLFDTSFSLEFMSNSTFDYKLYSCSIKNFTFVYRLVYLHPYLNNIY